MGLLSSLLGQAGVDVGGGGILGQLGQSLHDNSGALLGFAGGGPAGMIQGKRADMLAAAQRQEQEDKAKKLIAAQKLAETLHFDPALAQDPDAMRIMLQKQQQDRSYGLQASEAARQADQWKQEFAFRQQGGPSEVARILRDQGIDPASDEGRGFIKSYYQKKMTPDAPSGYRYNQAGSLEAIPGGPHDQASGTNKAIPAEIASKFGLVDEYEKAYPGIEKDLTSGDSSVIGVWDQPRAAQGAGPGGTIYRDMKLGSEAMVRLLTGAGRSESEAQEEAKQYLPRITDTAEQVLDKQKRLRSALRSMQRQVMSGRMPQEQLDRLYPPIDRQKAVEPTQQAQKPAAAGSAQAAEPKGLPSGAYDYVPGKGLVPRQ